MRAIVSGSDGARVAERPEPTGRDGECIVRIRASLVTPADAAASRQEPSTILGESAVGVVERLIGTSGPAQPAAAWIGKRVAIHPVIRCGRCDRCLAGLSSHCRERAILGRAGRSGCLAERIAVPFANLALVPDTLDDERASFASLVAEALEATKQIRLEGKGYITVLGDSLAALVTAQVMTRLNAAVRVIARQPTTLGLAEKLGIRHRHADEIGRRGDQDVVVDCIGTAESLAFASMLVRARGTVVLKSLPLTSEPAAADLSPIILGELTVQGSFHGPLPEAITLLAKRGIEVTPLIERKVTFDQATPLRSGSLLRVTQG
jgi:alcohol dehydrogenase